ncbi:hypothetical protein LEP1GSC170_0573 [Leptospira interrogans serovar Bataviae str. HAI135]|nr:hypothetical protein LEP1GSC170_0573 [Leptospira interrogans serovar Bataviae str. HAI135]
MIFNELLSNSLKHAFHSEKGTVQISFRKKEVNIAFKFLTTVLESRILKYGPDQKRLVSL